MSLKRALAPKAAPSELQYVEGVVKLFIGALPNKLKRKHFRRYFIQFGPIKDIIFPIKDKETRTTVGHAFIEFESTESVRKVAEQIDGHYLMDKLVDIKISKPRNSTSPNYKAFQQLTNKHFGEFVDGKRLNPNPVENNFLINSKQPSRQLNPEKLNKNLGTQKRLSRRFFNSKKKEAQDEPKLKNSNETCETNAKPEKTSDQEETKVKNSYDPRMSSPFIRKLGLEKEIFESVESFGKKYSLFKSRSLIRKQQEVGKPVRKKISWGLDID